MAAPVCTTPSITDYFQSIFTPYEKAQSPRVIPIIGGPGFGKSTTTNKLREVGFPVIMESARILIVEDEGKGIEKPQTKAGFDERVIAKQIEQEKAVVAALSTNTCCTSIIFSDRAIIDPAIYAYTFSANKEVPLELASKVQQALTANNGIYFPFVFLIEPLDEKDYIQDTQRLSTYEKALELHKTLREGYQALGFKIISVEKDSIENRVKFIQETVLKEMTKQP